MKPASTISAFLTAILHDWEDTRSEFPRNARPAECWPIPFFGNPSNALIATIGINPSSTEFHPDRSWSGVKTPRAWKVRLREYFKLQTPPHPWFKPWIASLPVIACSYQAATAFHLDASYRSTSAMVTNTATDHREFRHMIDRDVAWLFQLLPLCPELRVLLTFGPVVRHDGTKESLADYLRRSAPRHGFTVLPDGSLCTSGKGHTPRAFYLHEVKASGQGTLEAQFIRDLTLHRTRLLKELARPI